MSLESHADLRGAVALAHSYLLERVRPGDRVVDATCGNGNDTLLLARLVGEQGRVWAFDIQEEALHATAELLDEAGCRQQVKLFAMGHERMADVVAEPLKAVVFNLGYLPGGDKACVTRPVTTVAALEAACQLVAPGGVILVALYPGHPGGAEECAAVEGWGAELMPHLFNVWLHRQLNRPDTAPYLLLAEKRTRPRST
ncbi:MAG: methyltransferase domain-containing protein [Geobacter sp.]|nr:methyltransferase domain-containing protein [Geobacter sp.]